MFKMLDMVYSITFDWVSLNPWIDITIACTSFCDESYLEWVEWVTRNPKVACTGRHLFFRSTTPVAYYLAGVHSDIC